jgi:acetyl esterase
VTASRSWQETLTHRLAQGLTRVPPSVTARLGGPPRVVDGQSLDPHLAAVLALQRRRESHDPADRSPEARRAALAATTRILAGPPDPVGGSRDVVVDGAQGPLRARHYRPPASVEGGLPVGVQLMAPAFEEADLFEAARAYAGVFAPPVPPGF